MYFCRMIAFVVEQLILYVSAKIQFYFVLFTLWTVVYWYYFPKDLSDTLKFISKNQNKYLML